MVGPVAVAQVQRGRLLGGVMRVVMVVGLVVDGGVVTMGRNPMGHVRIVGVDGNMVAVMMWRVMGLRMVGRMVRIHQGGGVRLRMVMGHMVRIRVVWHMVRIRVVWHMVRVHMVRVHMVRVHMVRVHMVGIRMVRHMVGIRQVLRQVIGVGQVMVRIRVVDQSGVRVHEVGHVVGEELPSLTSLQPRVQVVQGGPLAHLVA